MIEQRVQQSSDGAVCTLVYIEDVELQTPPSEHICRGGGGWRRCLGWQRWPALAEICRLLRRSPKVRISNAMTVRYIALVNASEQLYCLREPPARAELRVFLGTGKRRNCRTSVTPHRCATLSTHRTPFAPAWIKTEVLGGG